MPYRSFSVWRRYIWRQKRALACKQFNKKKINSFSVNTINYLSRVMKTFKFSFVKLLRIFHYTRVSITLDENSYGIHHKRVIILCIYKQSFVSRFLVSKYRRLTGLCKWSSRSFHWLRILTKKAFTRHLWIEKWGAKFKQTRLLGPLQSHMCSTRLFVPLSVRRMDYMCWFQYVVFCLLLLCF